MDRTSKVHWIENALFTAGGRKEIVGVRVELYTDGLTFDGKVADEVGDDVIDKVYHSLYG